MYRKNDKTYNLQNSMYQETEQMLKRAAEELPEPQKEMPVLPARRAGRSIRPWKMAGRVAAVLCVFLLLGGSTAAAASPGLRQAVIDFITGGAKEKVPYEKLAGKDQGEDAQTDPKETDTPVTVGNVTLLQNQVLDEHFTASYLSSPDYLDTLITPSGKELFYTIGGKNRERTYYQLADGGLKTFSPKTQSCTGEVVLERLPGIMDAAGDRSAWSLQDLKFTVTVDWQQWGDDILVLNNDVKRFVIDDTAARQPDGESGWSHEASIYAHGLSNDTQWVEVLLLIDAQMTQYHYPFLFNIRTGRVKDPLAEVDLSAYQCITDMEISDDGKTASAKAGRDHESLNKITIDLATGSIVEEKTPAVPVSDHYLSYVTGEHTVFYTTGTQECMNGYLYNDEKGTTKTLFRDAAWGYTWEYGFADTYVEMIGGNYAAVFKEPENEVYLLNLADGNRQLLKGIPASHEIQFFWNTQYSMLSITKYTEQGTTWLAFFTPDTGHAWYFDRTPSEDVEEHSSCWYGERGYLIQAVSKEQDMYYLHLYEYTP